MTKPLADLQNPSEAFTEWVVAPDKAAAQDTPEGKEDEDSGLAQLKPLTEEDLELRWEAQVQLMQDWSDFLHGKN